MQSVWSIVSVRDWLFVMIMQTELHWMFVVDKLTSATRSHNKVLIYHTTHRPYVCTIAMVVNFRKYVLGDFYLKVWMMDESGFMALSRS